MNFLAHAYLSENDKKVMIGNFIADAVKGNSYERFPDGIRKGILLHRFIDEYTDNHEVFKASKKRLQPTYDKFSGVIVDIYYDHFLAKNWSEYSDIPLKEFVSEAYSILIDHFFILPARSKRILPFMVSQNWLVGYANFKDLDRVFHGMSNRTRRYNSGMENAVTDLQKNYQYYLDEFTKFFPQIIDAARIKKGSLI